MDKTATEIKRVFDEVLQHQKTTIEAYSTPGEYCANIGDWLITPAQLDAIRERVQIDAIIAPGTYCLKFQITARPE